MKPDPVATAIVSFNPEEPFLSIPLTQGDLKTTWDTARAACLYMQVDPPEHITKTPENGHIVTNGRFAFYLKTHLTYVQPQGTA